MDASTRLARNQRIGYAFRVVSPRRSRHLGTTRPQAFSLVEILVVVSIIAVLAGMLMAAIPMITRSARSSVCSSNLRQISLAALSYSGDNQGGMVPNYGTNPDGTNSPSYTDFLYPYIEMNSGTENKQKKNVFVCPSGRAMKTSAEGGWDWLWNYGLNNALHPNFDVGTNWKTISIAQVKRQSETVNIADGTQPPSDASGNSSRVISVWNNWKANVNFYDDDGSWSAAMQGPTPDTTSGVLRYRHGNSGYNGQLCNIAWLDGHVSGVGHRILVKSVHFAAELR